MLCGICAEKSLLDLCVIWTLPWFHIPTLKPLCYLGPFRAATQTSCRHHRLQYFPYVLLSRDILHTNFLVCWLDFLKSGSMFLPHAGSLSQIHLQTSRGKKKDCTAVLQLLPYKALGWLKLMVQHSPSLSQHSVKVEALKFHFSLSMAFLPITSHDKKLFCLYRDDILSSHPKAGLLNLCSLLFPHVPSPNSDAMPMPWVFGLQDQRLRLSRVVW